jgi:hypothetical protein
LGNIKKCTSLIAWLLLFKKVIAVCPENHIELAGAICGQIAKQLNGKAGAHS